MPFLKATSEFGIIVRKHAMQTRGVTRDELFRALAGTPHLDEDDHILSRGPCFGEEAANQLVRSLEGLGLTYVDDFFVMACDIPDWCEVGVCFAST